MWNRRHISLIALLIMLSPFSTVLGQRMEAPKDRTQRDDERISQPRSRAKQVLLNIAGAVLQALCEETGRCPSARDTSAENSDPSCQGFDRRPTLIPPSPSDPSSLGNTRSSDGKSSFLNFSFSIPSGWQRYDEISSVTLAAPNEYLYGNLTNGVILGLYDMSTVSFEKGAEKYVKELMSNNKYLKRVSSPEGSVVDGIPCMVNRLAGQSPKSGYAEQVVVHACKQSEIKIFYLVTVISGPNVDRYDNDNNRIAQSIVFARAR
jgi:hypothetical protein